MYAGAHNRGATGFTRYVMGFYFNSSAPFTLNNVQTATYVAVNLAIHDPDWFISDQAYGYLASNAGTCMDLYNKMFPNEAVGSTEAWLSLARDNISTYPEAIKAVTGTQITTGSYLCTRSGIRFYVWRTGLCKNADICWFE